MARRSRYCVWRSTPKSSAPFRDTLIGLRGSVTACLWSFAFLCSALSFGLCRSDAEFSILEEAQVLSEQMKKLSTQELGVFTMQRIFNSFVYTEKTSNGETEVQQSRVYSASCPMTAGRGSSTPTIFVRISESENGWLDEGKY